MIDLVDNPLVGMLGDIHGGVYTKPLDVFHGNGVKVVFQVGDFGLFDNHITVEFLDALQAALQQRGITMYAIRGNHDSNRWEKLLEIEPKDNATGGVFVRSNIVLMPRTGLALIRYGERCRKTRNLAYAGGARSIDKALRIPGVSWWPEEELTEVEVQYFPGTKADILITHDAPSNSPWPRPLIVDAASEAHRQKIDIIRDKCMPTLHFHGHMHMVMDWRDNGTRTCGLDCNGLPGSYGILDVDTMRFGYGGFGCEVVQ